MRAIAIRVLAAFWVCVILTALLFAPPAVLVRGRGFPEGFSTDPAGYIFNNSFLRMNQYDIAGTPLSVPDAEI